MPRSWLRLLRQNKGFTQTQLAKSLAVARQNVAAWETGAKTPSRDNVFRLADLLGPEVLTQFEAEARAKGVA